jgi:hypothetical protein
MLARSFVRALVLGLVLAGGCSSVGHVQYENNRCLVDGTPASLSEVETRLAAVSQRISQRQPWFAVVTLVVVLIAGASNADKLFALLRARHEAQGRPWSERLRDALQRHRQSPVRYFAIVGTLTTLLVIAVGFYVYLDADKRASERALSMLQFCNRELKNDEQQLALDEQRRNLAAIQATAGDIRALVDKLPPEEQHKAQQIIEQMNKGLAQQGKIVSDWLNKSDEAAKQLLEHTADLQKSLGALSGDVAKLQPLPGALRDLAAQAKASDGKIGDGNARLTALDAKIDVLDGELKKLLARPACEPSKPLATALRPVDMR